MQMCEHVLVTIQFDNICLDMELPCFFEIKQLQDKILEMLRVYAPQLVAGTNHLVLKNADRILHGSDTLAQCGIWDGNILRCDSGN